MNDAAQTRLRQTIETRIDAAGQPGLDRLTEELKRRHGASVQAILFYGSCLRSGNLYDGLADLYLIVDDYRSFYRARMRAFANWLLPPNVFYLETQGDGRKLRAKYAVISASDFAHGTSRRWFHSYLWGRFTQPVALAYARDGAAHARVIDGLAQAIVTFLNRALPRVADRGSLRALWIAALQLSYRAELRAEGGNRATELVTLEYPWYRAITQAAAPLLAQRLELLETDIGLDYRAQVAPSVRTAARATWALRHAQGKLLSLLRLSKALFTFEGGLDYIAWKLERHSGQPITIPERVRRYPLIFVWGLVWRLYRRGVFR